MDKEQFEIYDRNIRVWGEENQLKLINSSALIIGLNSTTCEIAKNLVLSGIKVILYDDDLISDKDIEHCFFFNSEEKNMKKSEILSKKLKEMSKFASVGVISFIDIEEIIGICEICYDYFFSNKYLNCPNPYVELIQVLEVRKELANKLLIVKYLSEYSNKENDMHLSKDKANTQQIKEKEITQSNNDSRLLINNLNLIEMILPVNPTIFTVFKSTTLSNILEQISFKTNSKYYLLFSYNKISFFIYRDYKNDMSINPSLNMLNKMFWSKEFMKISKNKKDIKKNSMLILFHLIIRFYRIYEELSRKEEYCNDTLLLVNVLMNKLKFYLDVVISLKEKVKGVTNDIDYLIDLFAYFISIVKESEFEFNPVSCVIAGISSQECISSITESSDSKNKTDEGMSKLITDRINISDCDDDKIENNDNCIILEVNDISNNGQNLNPIKNNTKCDIKINIPTLPQNNEINKNSNTEYSSYSKYSCDYLKLNNSVFYSLNLKQLDFNNNLNYENTNDNNNLPLNELTNTNNIKSYNLTTPLNLKYHHTKYNVKPISKIITSINDQESPANSSNTNTYSSDSNTIVIDFRNEDKKSVESKIKEICSENKLKKEMNIKGKSKLVQTLIISPNSDDEVLSSLFSENKSFVYFYNSDTGIGSVFEFNYYIKQEKIFEYENVVVISKNNYDSDRVEEF